MLAAFSMTGVLIVIVVIMYWIASVARKRLGVGAGTVAPDQLRIVGKRTLDRTKALYVVEVGDRYVLLGAAENSVSLVDHITAEEFASMTDMQAAEAGAAAREKLAKVGRKVVPIGGKPAEGNEDAAANDDEEPRFATVGESFSMLLNKAKRNRSGQLTTTDGANALALATDEDLEG